MPQEQLHMLSFLGTAQDQPDRFVFALVPFVLFQPCEVKIHLTFVSRRECAEFQVNGHKTPQATVEEKQVEIIVGIVNTHRELTPHKTEIRTQLGQELLQIANDGRLQILLRVGAFESKEIENIGVLENVIVSNNFWWAFLFLKRNELTRVPR
ncbi:MAG: hypothetical protein A2340_05300 [Lentisphaerae bacterium RIFOXYB12_FULL_60_10]|nr:MAG: hypothetical protein A2340_05300 [Lentisphaerae bacterium RIFOXYB12_FULL_60_10]